MNRRAAIGVVLSAAAIAPRAARAADREIEILTDPWRKSKDLTLRVAEAMPAENYDYKPFAEARSFGGELQHLAQAEGYSGRAGDRSLPRATPARPPPPSICRITSTGRLLPSAN
jgi:hypothetical protein